MAQRGGVTRLRVKIHLGLCEGERERRGGSLFCFSSPDLPRQNKSREEGSGGGRGELERGEVLGGKQKREREDKMTGDRASAST